jgi:amidase
MADVVAYNKKRGKKVIPYGMDLLEAAEATAGDWSEPEYHFDRARDIRLCREEGIDACLKTHRLDAILAPMDRAAKMTGKAGYPAVSVPCGFTKDGVPVGISFVGTAWSEPTLIQIAYGAERALAARKPPKYAP